MWVDFYALLLRLVGLPVTFLKNMVKKALKTQHNTHTNTHTHTHTHKNRERVCGERERERERERWREPRTNHTLTQAL